MNALHSFLAGLFLFACIDSTHADIVTDWNEVLERATKTNAFNAAIQARTAAIVHAAMYDAVNGIAHTYAPYFIRETAPGDANPEAAAAQAAHATLSWLFPNLVTNFDATLTVALTQITNSGAHGAAIAQGLGWGASVAARVIAWRAQDGFTNAMPGYFGGTNIGQWRSVPTPTAPDGSLPAIVPQLAVMTPFALTSPAQFRPGPPYGMPLAQALASAEYAADFNEVKAIGRVDSATRTAEQVSIARLWQASSTAEMNNCLRQVVPGTNSLVDNARLFLLANIVAADGLIAGFDSKYTYNFWRPHHAIRFGDLDDNPDTEADPAWSALIIAPRHQEYISNHAVHSGGMAYALARLLGDAHTFTLGSVDFPGFTWTFQSFSELRVQVKEARIWAGIHYRNSCDVGEAVGHQIADYVLDNFLRPATALGITQQPQDQTAIAGSNATFSVVATGTEPLCYQWRSYSSALVFTNIPAATNASLILRNVQPTSQRFGVVVTDGFGLSVTSAPPVRLTVVSRPTIVVEPSDRNVVGGESATLNVAAIGTGPLAYQWSFNGQPRSGATASNLVIASVQSSNAGNYQIVVTNSYGAATSRVATLTIVPPVLFTRVTNGSIATDLGQSTGCVWADFDNDGYLDLYVAQYWSEANFFYRNNRNGQFTRITAADFLVTSGYNLGVSAADYDNDGWLDFIVTSGGASPTPRRSTLFHNDGDGTFSRASGGGITNNLGWFPSAQWADYDNDGFVDVLITQSDATESGAYTNLLWHNNGDGTFGSVTGDPIVTDRMAGWGLLWSDYDGDGFVDALVMNITDGHNFLYHNSAQGSFTRVTNSAVVTDEYSRSNASADWGDYDNDGLLDLIVPDGGGRRHHLYHNEGGGTFSDVMIGAMLTPPTGANGRSVAWGDYDNDGYLDLLVGYFDRNLVYRNNSDGSFSEIKSAAPVLDQLPDPSFFFNTRTWVDYDNDGFLDLHLTGGSFTNPRLRNSLYHNAGNSNGWLEVKCIGTVANRSAIGAKIRIKASIGGETFWQMRELSSGSGFILAKPLVAHFGIGDATIVESLRIEWPGGSVQELHNVTPRQILTITEPPRLTATQVSGQPQFTLRGGRNMTYDIEGSSNLGDWSHVTTVNITNISGTAPINDLSPARGSRFYRAVGR